MTATDENDFPLCTCGHSSAVHARLYEAGAIVYPCRQVLPAEEFQSEPPPCPCSNFEMAR